MWEISDQNPHKGNLGDTDSPGIDLMHYWLLFWRNKLFIVACGILLAIPTAIYMKGQVSTYESTVSLLLDANQQVNLTSIQDLYGIDTQSRSYTSTQYQLLQSRNIAERVIRDLNLLEHPEFLPQTANTGDGSGFSLESWTGLIPDFIAEQIGLAESSDQPTISAASTPPQGRNNEAWMRRVVSNFSRRMTVIPVRNTDIVNVGFTATDPNLAATIANQIAVAYIESDMEQRISATQQASRWLSERVTSLNQTLQESEERLQNYMEREQLVDAGGVTTLNTQEIDQLSSQLIAAQNRKAETESVYRQLQNLETHTTESLLSIPFILNSPIIQPARQALEGLQRRYAELSTRYGRNHPTMIDLMAQITTAEARFSQEVLQLVTTIENNHLAAIEAEQNIQARLDQSINELQGVNRKSFELRELEREVETNRQLYNMFFTRIRETQETDDLQRTNAVIVDPAVPALFPSGPQRKRAVLMALMAGLMLGGGLVFLRDMLDTTLKTHVDIENKLKVPVIGIVPFVKKEKSERKQSKKAFLGFIQNHHSSFAESLRTIRTSLTLSSLDQPFKTISITSSLPDEGKTTLAINLASVMGQMGRVVLIETDLRKPSIASSLGLPENSPGLADYLAGNNSLKECLYYQESGKITVMPAGQRVPNPLELLSSEKFKSLLKIINSNFDRVILDTPPTQAVSDALVIGNLVDAVVFVVKAEATSVKVVKNQLKRLFNAEVNMVGVVLNQINIEKSSDYGGYYDSYGYATVSDNA